MILFSLPKTIVLYVTFHALGQAMQTFLMRVTYVAHLFPFSPAPFQYILVMG